MKNVYTAIALLGLGLLACGALSSCKQGMKYPVTEKGDVVDSYFGTEVPDPYRWLENDTTKRVQEWVEEENALTDEYLSKIPFRNSLRKRMSQLMDYDRESPPYYTGKYYIFYRRTGLQNQPVLFIQDSIDGEPRVLIDPNTFSDDGTVALAETSVSHDSKYIAYAVADGGSDWRTIHVMDIESGQKLSDEIRWSKFSTIAWYKDGFYYTGYDAPEKGKELSSVNQFCKIFYHKVGTPQSKDRLVFQNKEQPYRTFTSQVTHDEKYLLVSEMESTDGNSLYIQNLEIGGQMIQLTTGFDYEYRVIGSKCDDLYILTNLRAPKNRLVRVNMDRPDVGEWKDIIPEGESVLSDCTYAGGKLVAVHMVDAASRMAVYNLDGQKVRDIDLGVLGSVAAVSGDPDRDDLFYSYTSFTVPSLVYRYNLASDERSVFFAPKFDFDFAGYETEQVFFTSKDGSKIPMFIVYKKGIERNGENPTMLYGYGGFNVSLTPSFNPVRLAWLEQGGIFAMANLRGGGEYGEGWHKAGTKLQKQNVFDDFIAAAHYLIDEKYTSSAKLAIRGGSNGGLLIGAVVNQTPDLYAVAIPQVGVMDMLRYQLFTIGWAWAGDYGTSDDPEHFKNLFGISPIHNIKPGRNYPAILVTTADHDDRVVPAHSFKYIATLQAKQPEGKPKLIRIETRAGHSAGKPTSLQIDEMTDVYAFTWYNMGFVPRY